MKSITNLSPDLLNSERIFDRFGSYRIEVLKQESGLRLSNLITEQNGRPTTRTLATVHMLWPTLYNELEPCFVEQQEIVRNGGSICATFKSGGWAIKKTNLAIDELRITDSQHFIKTLMNLETDQTMVLHIYLLQLCTQVEQRHVCYDYAAFAELHHPEYLTKEQIEQIHGDWIDEQSVYHNEVALTKTAMCEAIQA